MSYDWVLQLSLKEKCRTGVTDGNENKMENAVTRRQRYAVCVLDDPRACLRITVTLMVPVLWWFNLSKWILCLHNKCSITRSRGQEGHESVSTWKVVVHHNVAFAFNECFRRILYGIYKYEGFVWYLAAKYLDRGGSHQPRSLCGRFGMVSVYCCNCHDLFSGCFVNI